jgi:hypothetical protein
MRAVTVRLEAVVRIGLLRGRKFRVREEHTVGVTYTAYSSPNQMFGTVKELSFKFAVDDSGRLGAAAVKPYALLAQELDGQADGGANEGTYLELGIGPGYSLSKMSVTMPVKSA